MNKRDMLIEEARRLCADVAVDFDQAYQELSDLISSDNVVDYCITKGPYPNFPKTLADVFILSDWYIYDYELRDQGSLRHILPLSMIRQIGERFAQSGEETFLGVTFSYGFAGLIMQDKLSNREKLRRFAKSVRNKLIDKQKAEGG